jgi:hypothetical protein
LRLEQPGYAAALAQAEAFGCQLELEASRGGVAQAQQVIGVGDGAQWIWNLAEQLLPGATHIVDWYQASQDVWNAARAIAGDAQEHGPTGRSSNWKRAGRDEAAMCCWRSR